MKSDNVANFDYTGLKTPRYVYDLDQTIIESRHRQLFDSNGKLDINHWIHMKTYENVMKDTLLPVASHMKDVYKRGHCVVICTSRNINQFDLDFLKKHNLNFHIMLCRKHGDHRSSADMKYELLSNLMNEHKCHTIFYEDHNEVLKKIKTIDGISPIDSKPINYPKHHSPLGTFM